MAGIKEVAKRAGVSISTVSRVLNQSKYVSPEIVRKVQVAVEELSYKADPVARNMKRKETKMIGIITADICGLFYPYIIEPIYQVANEKGYQITVCDSQGVRRGESGALEREFERFQGLIDNRVDGIIFVSVVTKDRQEHYLKQLQKLASGSKEIPLVSLERDFSEYGIDSVYFDGYSGAKTAVNHLLDCGCKKIAHITGPQFMNIVEERIRGYRDALRASRLGTAEEMIAEGNYSHPSGYKAMKELLDKFPDLDGVFCGNDQMAVGAMKAIQELGRKMPEEIKVIGYDDVFVSSVVQPALSTIHVSKKKAGFEIARTLFDRIEKKNESPDPVRTEIPTRLIIRQSTVSGSPDDWILSEW